MSLTDILRVIFGLATVISLIGLTALLVRQSGLITMPRGLARKRRLSVSESLALDSRRRLLIVNCDGREHLIILGAGSETLIENGLAMPAPEALDDIPRANPFAELRRAFSGAKAERVDVA